MGIIYSELPGAAVQGNIIGVIVFVIAMLVIYITENPAYKRVESYETIH